MISGGQDEERARLQWDLAAQEARQVVAAGQAAAEKAAAAAGQAADKSTAASSDGSDWDWPLDEAASD